MKTQLTLITDILWTLKEIFLLLLRISFFFVIFDAFSHLVVTNAAPQTSSKYSIRTLLHHCITKFGQPQNLIIDRGTEYRNQDMTHLCSLFNFDHSRQTLNSPWTNGSVEVQNRNLGTHTRLFLQNLPNNLSLQTKMYAYALNTTPLSQLKLYPTKLFFILILVSLNFSS